MRIRSIKPEFWQSEDISALSIEDRLLFIGLWSYVDDNGVGRDQPVNICTSLFAGDFVASPAETLARIADGLQNLATRGRITRYTVDGAAFIAIANWKRHQKIDRPNKPRLPEPTHCNAVLTTPNAQSGTDSVSRIASNAESLASIAETLPVRNRGTGEQGNRGTGEQVLSPVADAPSKSDRVDDDFAEWYAAYPRKTARGRALTAYRTARKKTDAAILLAAVKQQASQLMAKGSEFAPYPATWLNGERWSDELPADRPAPKSSSWDIVDANGRWREPPKPPAHLMEPRELDL